MKKRATAQEVAQLAGVSKWTVIRAFTPGASITEVSRAKVMAAAEQMNYRPNLLARSLATRSTRQVAVFVDDFANPYKLQLIEATTAALQAEGLVALLVNINEHLDHVHAILNADQRQVDAVVLLGTSFREETLADSRLRDGGPPLFVLARDSQLAGIPAVSCDSAVAMEEICRHLAARGFRRPGFMSGPRTLSTALGRHRHFRDHWASRSIEVAELQASPYSHAAGATAMRAYLAANPPGARIDVLVCENDILAHGALDVLRHEAGLSVPSDMAVVGFDDAAPSALPGYDLTTYRQPVGRMVETLVDMLSGRRPHDTIVLRGELVLRSSA